MRLRHQLLNRWKVLAFIFTTLMTLSACAGPQIVTVTPDAVPTGTSPAEGSTPDPTAPITTSTAAPTATPAPTATTTPNPTPTPTPVPPIASFEVDVRAGTAPLSVRFIDTSEGPVSSYEWDFGDGNTSTEAAPVHEFTKAGTHNIRLTISGPNGSDNEVRSSYIAVQPGPIVGLSVNPENATVGAGEAISLSAVAVDRFGNAVSVDPIWSLSTEDGSIDSSGTFTAGTETRSISDHVMAMVITNVGSIEATASVTIIPGAIANLEIVPAEIVVLAEEAQQLLAKASDSFGNEIVDPQITWSVVETIGSVDDKGLFVAGTEAGTHVDVLTVTGEYGGGVAVQTASITVDSGLIAAWDMEGDVVDSKGAADALVSTNIAFLPGIDGSALKIDQSSLVQIIGDPALKISADSPSTLETWIYPTSFDEEEIVLGAWKDNYYGLMYLPDQGVVRAHVHDGEQWIVAETTFNVPLYSWTHVVQVWDGTRFDIYINGVPMPKNRFRSDDPRTTEVPLFIGSRFANDGQFTGLHDGVKIYRRALTSLEISKRFLAGDSSKSFDGLTNWWRAEGNAADSIGNNHGNLRNGTAFRPGVAGGSFSFDGSNDVVAITNQLDLSSSFSFSAWINIDPAGFGNSVSIFANRAVSIRKNSPPQDAHDFEVCLLDSLLQHRCARTPAIAASGVWTHLVVTWDGAALLLYINGELMGRHDGPIEITTATTQPAIGRESVDGSFDTVFHGSIDEVRIYNRALSQAEVSAQHDSEVPA